MIARTRKTTSRLGLPPAQGTSEHALEYANLRWLDIVQPGTDQVAVLRERYAFHPLHLEDVLSYLQRPKIDDNPDEGYVFMVVHFPIFDKTNRVSVVSEIDIFAGRDYIITMHDGKLKPLVRLVRTAADEQVRMQLMGRGSGYLLYRIIEALISYCFPMLYRIDQHLDRIESNIFAGSAPRMVEELSFVRRDIIAMRRIIKPNITVVRSLEVRERDFLRLDEEVYFGDLTDGLAKLWDMLEEQKEIIEGLNATLDSLTSHRINQEMKTFTLISVLILPMTLVASILGMNVLIPYSETPWALPVVLLLMLFLGFALFVYFRYKKWV
ncbi:MAG: magnesium transporter CorA family protein [Chloroflexaceae bacterium]|nr:magnesium transporter CorA family protein [Chloroflexaceae bacterium]NJO05472.1 magnesium transporter CorA family protein [Chloroflexaceae bacterium]